MKLFHIVFFLLINNFVFSQNDSVDMSPDNLATLLSNRKGCGILIAPTKNLTCRIVDGIAMSKELFNTIDTATIESVDSLKPPVVQLLCGRDYSSVIIVTLRKQKRLVTIVDTETGERLVAGLGVRFGRQSAYLHTDSLGQIDMTTFPLEKNEHLEVSSIGFKKYDTLIADGKFPDTIRLQQTQAKDYIIISCGLNGDHRVYTANKKVEAKKKSPSSTVATELTTYPNPLTRGQQQTIEWTASKNASYTLQVVDQGGKMLWSTSIEAKAGVNRYTWQPAQQWTAGSYILRLSSADGKYVASSKMIRL
jgi:hypothetical protein